MGEMGKDSFIELGNVMVETTHNKGHDPEFWAEQITKKICEISADAAPHIRQQAEAFQNHLRHVLFHYMLMARREERSTIANRMDKVGNSEMADLVRRI